MPENDGYKFWKEKLGSPKFVVAPMVDQSELAWRILSRRHGAQLCYTPMLHASVFIRDAHYRKENLVSCVDDRPLIVQFCANDPDIFAKACELASDQCDAIDLNLGCPQAIARRGHYGAFLQDEWELLQEMIKRASQAVDVPITCKIRVFPDVEKTVQYAQRLEAAGCQVLTVHGRTKDQKGPLTGLASWDHIKAVKESVNVPVFANGNIQNLSDVNRCMEETGVDGVMIAEGSLHNPALFEGISPPVWEVTLEYLELAKQYPCPTAYVRGHVFKICHHCLAMEENKDIRQKIAVANRIEQFITAISELKSKYEKFTQVDAECDSMERYGLPYPPWLCQSYVRPPPVDATTNEENERTSDLECSAPSDKRLVTERLISRKKAKKLHRNPRKDFARKPQLEKCSTCFNPKGSKCSFQLCKVCCKSKSYRETLDCVGHHFTFRTRKNARTAALANKNADAAAEEPLGENVCHTVLSTDL